jgi:hypothetical protein
MKNYLFAPFKNNDEKIASFNNLINYLPKGHQSQMRIFVGSLESTYDAEICRLGEEHEHNENIAWGNGKVQELLIVQKGNIARIDELRIENNTLKLNNDKLRSENAVAVADERVINKLEDEIDELKRDNKRLTDGFGLTNRGDFDKIVKLQAELEKVKRCNKTMDGILVERDAEIKKQKLSYVKVSNERSDAIKELQAEVERLQDVRMRYASLKEYKKEAEEYFNNNPQSKGIRFHMIDFNDYDYDDNDGLNGMSGEYNGLLLAEDSLIEIDNPHLK